MRGVPVAAHDFDEEEALDFGAGFGRGDEWVGEGGEDLGAGGNYAVRSQRNLRSDSAMGWSLMLA